MSLDYLQYHAASVFHRIVRIDLDQGSTGVSKGYRASDQAGFLLRFACKDSDIITKHSDGEEIQLY